ncbi:MAG: hypothetical protein Alpg2KO_06980 [Alphaproteobacteria bacterium]
MTESKTTDGREIAPLEDRLTGRTRELADVAEARAKREEHGQVEGISGNALQRMSEITNSKLSLQRVMRGTGKLAADVGRRAIAPIVPSKAPSNTPFAKALRRLALRGMMDGIYRQSGELIFAGSSDNLLELAKEDGHDMHGLDAHGVRLRGSRLYGLKAEGADFRSSWLASVDFNRAKLDGARFSRAKMVGRFEKSGYRDYRNDATQFCNASLKGADFRQAHLYGVDFHGADLTGADFTRARFKQTKQFAKPGEVAFTIGFSLTGIGALLCWAGGEFDKDGAFQMLREKVNFRGANLDGVRFSVNAPFDQFDLTDMQRDQIVLVDRRGNVRDDLKVGRDGSLVMKPKSETEAPSLPGVGS